MTAQTQDDILENLPYETYYEAFYKLRDTLPPPLEETPEGYARRDRAVLNQIRQLVPASAIEAELAAKCVAAGEFALGCMREARQLVKRNPSRHDQLGAQAARMGRESRGYLASLHKVQAVRIKREATEAGAYRADALEEYAGDLLLRALDNPPNSPSSTAGAAQPGQTIPLLEAAAPPALPPIPPPAQPLALPAEPAAGAPALLTEADIAAAAEPACRPAVELASGPAAGSASRPAAAKLPAPPNRYFPAPAANRLRSRTSDADDDETMPDWAALAERYAIRYPQRAQLIRRLGGLPERCDFGPPEPELVRAIVRGTTPELVALD